MNKHAKTNAASRAIAAKDFLRSGMAMIRGHSADSFSCFAGSVLFFIGLAEILGVLGRSQVLGLADPIFGISFRHLMLVVGMVQLVVSFLLLFTNWRTLGLALVAWITANFLVFRIGLWSMGWHHSSGFMVEQLGLSLTTMDVVTGLFSAFLLMGSCAVLWLERRARQAAESLKISCPSCGGHIRFAIQNLGQQTTCPHCKAAIRLRKTEGSMKMSCVLCGGHIEFPVHAIGQKIPCPHCAKTITLLNPA
jgi:RNase P subunit RPR2